jgi:flagellar biosynthesis protein FlhA
LAAHAARSQNSDDLTAVVRLALNRTICQNIMGMAPEIRVMTLESEMEQLLLELVQSMRKGNLSTLEPGMAERFLREIAQKSQEMEMNGMPPVLLTSEEIRLWLYRFTRSAYANLKVLGYGEIPGSKQIKVVATLGRMK